jgi:hypothetical protein
MAAAAGRDEGAAAAAARPAGYLIDPPPEVKLFLSFMNPRKSENLANPSKGTLGTLARTIGVATNNTLRKRSGNGTEGTRNYFTELGLRGIFGRYYALEVKHGSKDSLRPLFIAVQGAMRYYSQKLLSMLKGNPFEMGDPFRLSFSIINRFVPANEEERNVQTELLNFLSFIQTEFNHRKGNLSRNPVLAAAARTATLATRMPAVPTGPLPGEGGASAGGVGGRRSRKQRRTRRRHRRTTRRAH